MPAQEQVMLDLFYCSQCVKAFSVSINKWDYLVYAVHI